MMVCDLVLSSSFLGISLRFLLTDKGLTQIGLFEASRYLVKFKLYRDSYYLG